MGRILYRNSAAGQPTMSLAPSAPNTYHWVVALCLLFCGPWHRKSMSPWHGEPDTIAGIVVLRPQGGAISFRRC